MIVYAPEIVCADGQCTITARVEGESRIPLGCDSLSYSVPEEFTDMVTTRVDGFAAVALIMAMRNGERLELRGRISERLLKGMHLYQKQLCEWFPAVFSPVEILASDQDRRQEKPARGLHVTAFSGGLDSCYTVVKEGARRSGGELDYALFAKFFRNPRADAAFPVAVEEYREKLAGIGIGLIPIVTNAQEFVAPVCWDIAHGAVLISTALILGAGIERFYIPGSGQFTAYGEVPHGFYTAWGSHPDVDPLLGTGRMEVIHHAVEVSRPEKLEHIGESEFACSLLHVCLKNPEGESNCARCKKCYVLLAVAGVLGVRDRLRTFPSASGDYKLDALSGPMGSWPATPLKLMEAGLYTGRTSLVWHGVKGALHHGVVLWRDKIAKCWRSWREMRNAVPVIMIDASSGLPTGTVCHDVGIERDGEWLLVFPHSRDPYFILPPLAVVAGSDLLLRAEIESPGTTRFEVFYAGDDADFVAGCSVAHDVEQGVEKFDLRVPVGGEAVRLRIDPCEQLTMYRIRSLRLFSVKPVVTI